MACLSLSWHVYVHGILFELSSIYADTTCDCVNRASAVTLHGCLLSHMSYVSVLMLERYNVYEYRV